MILPRKGTSAMTRFRNLSVLPYTTLFRSTLTVAAPAFGACLAGDADCDGVLDAFDLCPGTPSLELDYTSGCSACPCDAAWPSLAAYVSCVTAQANARYLAHTLTKAQKTAAITHAQKSTCGSPTLTRCCEWSKTAVSGSIGSCNMIQPASCSFFLLGKWAENRGPGSCYYNPCTW